MTDLQGHVSRDENGETRTGSVVAGRYRLLDRLGAGGFGRVWRARDEKLGVDVAIKEVWLPPSMSAEAHAERVVRAEREARNAARLRDHPNVVAVHDVVVDAGVPWTVMQLIEGRTLEEHIQAHGPLSVDNGARVARAMLKALGAAHAAGIVHRDVKPANVMLTTDHEVVLTDFGIAQQQADTSLTQTGTFIGSLEYVAPERLRGEEGQAISDLFSLGVTLYHALEGFSPFHRETATGAMTAVLFEEAPPPRQAGSLTPVLTGLMDKDPARRLTIAQATALLDRPQQASAHPATAQMPQHAQSAQRAQAPQHAPASQQAPYPAAQYPAAARPGAGSGNNAIPHQTTNPLDRPPAPPMRPGPVSGPAQGSMPQGRGPVPAGYPAPAPYPQQGYNTYHHQRQQVPSNQVGGWWMHLLPIAMLIVFGLVTSSAKEKLTPAESEYRLNHPLGGGIVATMGLSGAGLLTVFVVMFLLRRLRMPARVIGYIGVGAMVIGYIAYAAAMKGYANTAAGTARGRVLLHFGGNTGALVFGAFCVAAIYTVTEVMTRRAYQRMAARHGR